VGIWKIYRTSPLPISFIEIMSWGLSHSLSFPPNSIQVGLMERSEGKKRRGMNKNEDLEGWSLAGR
jgi:hypothetical protein